MDNVVSYNGLEYQVTSALKLDRDNSEKGRLYNFSLALVVNGRKQLSLNCLTLERRVDRRTNNVYMAISSPKQQYSGNFCSSIVFFPDVKDAIQNEDRARFINDLTKILHNAAEESLKKRGTPR